MKQILSLLILIAGATGAQAQSLVLNDDFRDGVVDPMWSVTFDPFAFWNVVETADQFHYMGLTTPFGANDERYTLNAAVPGGLGTTFQMDASMTWNDQIGFNPGENDMVFVIRLLGQFGTELASFRLEDFSTTDAGDVNLSGATNASHPGMPVSSGCDISIWRDSVDMVHYEMVVHGGATHSGSLGTVVGGLTNVEFYASHTAMGGPFGPFMGQLHLDYIRIWDGPTTVLMNLTSNGLTAGFATTFSMSQATPNGTVILGYSLAGNGPTSTPYGNAALSAPIQSFMPITADAAGDASMLVNVPAGTTGTSVWFQALDLTAGTLSNGLAEVVL